MLNSISRPYISWALVFCFSFLSSFDFPFIFRFCFVCVISLRYLHLKMWFPFVVLWSTLHWIRSINVCPFDFLLVFYPFWVNSIALLIIYDYKSHLIIISLPRLLIYIVLLIIRFLFLFLIIYRIRWNVLYSFVHFAHDSRFTSA